MSESSLPDDIMRWPADPFELLGVQPGIGARDLRRVYTRLIRTYKPEQYPEHFRRIREAYEFAQHFADGHAESSSGETLPAPQPMYSPDEDASPIESLGEPTLLREDDPDTLWEMAIAGRDEEAYRRLRELHRRRPGQSGLHLQLYWLLALNPALDPGCSPCDWLAEGLLANGVTGPLMELYRREIEEDPAEAVSERCNRLVQSSARAGALADLIAGRWHALARLKRWDVLASDMNSLRQRVQHDDETVWLRLLFLAADLLAFADADDAWQLRHTCLEEIKEQEELAIRVPHAFDRLDYLREIASDWWQLKRLDDSPELVVRLIPLSWTRSFPEARPALESLVEAVGQFPMRWVKHFDNVQGQAPHLLTYVCNLLAQLESYRGLSPPWSECPSEAAKLVAEYLEEAVGSRYSKLRQRLLDFCMEESIAPEIVAAVAAELSNSTDGPYAQLSKVINDDWSLRCAWKAHRLYWA